MRERRTLHVTMADVDIESETSVSRQELLYK